MQGQYEEALNSFDESIALDSNKSTYFYNRGMCYEKMNQLDKAMQDYTTTLSLNPKYYDALLNRGGIYAKNKQVSKAIIDFTQAINIRPKGFKAHINRALAYHGAGKFEQAIEDYTAVENNSKTPGDINIKLERGLAYFENNQYYKALDDFKTYLTNKPQNTQALHFTALTYAALHQDKKAIPFYLKAIALEPAKHEYHTNLGWSYILTLDLDKARNSLQLALDLEPNSMATLVNMGHTYLLQNKNDIAYQYYKKSIETEDNVATLMSGPIADFKLFIKRNWEKVEAEKALKWYQEQILILKKP
jgi:tetratricopeptide (TPR) repeat protein